MSKGPLIALALVAIVLPGGCRARPDPALTLPPGPPSVVARGEEPPVALDPESPIKYPPVLYQLRISGTVLLRLFVDETGSVIKDSSRIQESSGYPALDTAALAAAPRLRYAPALRNGVAVATHFAQPIRFRHPDRGGTTP